MRFSKSVAFLILLALLLTNPIPVFASSLQPTGFYEHKDHYAYIFDVQVNRLSIPNARFDNEKQTKIISKLGVIQGGLRSPGDSFSLEENLLERNTISIKGEIKKIDLTEFNLKQGYFFIFHNEDFGKIPLTEMSRTTVTIENLRGKKEIKPVYFSKRYDYSGLKEDSFSKISETAYSSWIFTGEGKLTIYFADGTVLNYYIQTEGEPVDLSFEYVYSAIQSPDLVEKTNYSSDVTATELKIKENLETHIPFKYAYYFPFTVQDFKKGQACLEFIQRKPEGFVKSSNYLTDPIMSAFTVPTVVMKYIIPKNTSLKQEEKNNNKDGSSNNKNSNSKNKLIEIFSDDKTKIIGGFGLAGLGFFLLTRRKRKKDEEDS